MTPWPWAGASGRSESQLPRTPLVRRIGRAPSYSIVAAGLRAGFFVVPPNSASDLRYVRRRRDRGTRLNSRWKESVSGMEIVTARFGPIEIAAGDLIRFLVGLSGLEDCLDWALVADAQSDALGWLQCTTRAEIALAVVSPRRFVPDYQLRVTRGQLAPLGLDSSRSAHVLVIVGKNERSITLNLKAPLIINLQRRLGRQVVASGHESVQHELCSEYTQRKRIA